MFEVIRTHFHAIRGLWRALQGRWFVLRDAPDDVVANIAALELRDDDAPALHQLVGDANAEMALRLKTLKHELEEAIADAEVGNLQPPK